MIVIPAKVKCDRYGCKAKVEIELVLKVDQRDIPSLHTEYDTLPEGWRNGNDGAKIIFARNMLVEEIGNIMVTRTQALYAFMLALKHLGQGKMVSSAKVCLEDVASLLADNNWTDARKRAIESIAYSVGMHHRDYSTLSVTST
jgi:hypothetical protein